ncbi:ZCF27 [Candida metapsilosis]|uniref:ZCF27 n=1 Tax=Candida metapsilosis TaxID=273372 RepID=A0A8H7ZHW0_9ASCO|nr:ZCF27 [Candida metapsilosis]
MSNQESHTSENTKSTPQQQQQQQQPAPPQLPPGSYYMQQYPTGYYQTQPLPEPPQYPAQNFRPQQQLPLPHQVNPQNEQPMQQQQQQPVQPLPMPAYYPPTYQQIPPYGQYMPTSNQPPAHYQYQSPPQQPAQRFVPPISANNRSVRFQEDANYTPQSQPQTQSPSIRREMERGQYSAQAPLSDPTISSSSPSNSSTRSKRQSPTPEKPSGEERPKKRSQPASRALSRTSATYPRKRAVTACDTCRLKKTKCDNVRPQCGSCARNGNTNCQYSTDDQLNDYSSYDPASLNILTKLDIILKDLSQMKDNGSARVNGSTDKKVDKSANNGSVEDTKRNEKQESDKCIWDMSATSIINWNVFKQDLCVTQGEVADIKHKLLNLYDRNNFIRHGKSETIHSFEEKFNDFKIVEQLLMSNFTNIINSFFVNIHTKLPILNVCEFFTVLELYQFLSSKIPELTFIKLLELFEKDELPESISQVYQDSNIELNEWEVEKLNLLVEFIPVILIISALGVSAIPVHLDNLTTFKNSLDESASTTIGCLSGENSFDGIPTTFTSNRTLIAYKLVAYSQSIIQMFPFVMKENTIRSTSYYLLKSQLHLQNNNPLRAHELNVRASRNIMYYLQKTNGGKSITDGDKKDVLDRLFWICLKLECELNIELSPFVSLSGIHHFSPPTLFPKVPEPITDDNHSKYSSSVLKLAQKYDDQYTWYYFLTEIAVRKVENKMLDDFYSLESTLNFVWDSEQFSNETVWTYFIKYSNQYNGIINSLTPEIRYFVLQEIDTDYIYKRIKKKYDKSKANGSNGVKEQNEQPRKETTELYNDIFDNLDDFLIDDDLLLRAQSESIMYIKTRVLTSKLLLFRPLVYLILEDKIPLLELINAAASVIGASISQQPALIEADFGFDTPISSSASNTISDSNDFSSALEVELDFFNLNNAPLFYQKHHPDEDFSSVIEYTKTTSDDESEDADFKVKDMAAARAKILRIFFQNLISIPKLNIPRLACHRHPGSWYYIRNLFIGSVMQYLMFKKIQQVIITASSNKELQAMMAQSMGGSDGDEGAASGEASGVKSFEAIVQMISSVVGKESIVANLEHSKIVFEYWKEEVGDCVIYQDIVTRMLAEL